MYLLIFNTFKFSNEVCLYMKCQKYKIQCDFFSDNHKIFYEF